MTRANNLERVWKKLGIVILSILGVMSVVMNYAGDARILSMMFIAGNLGGYCAIHRSLFDYSDDDLAQLSQSWFALILPPLIGGILSMVLYVIFISGIISGELFPTIVKEEDIPNSFDAIFSQHAEGPSDYAKLIFWGFVAGFNEKYVTNIIDSIKAKA
jgi:hypothetical protein